jgi:hypothetical protein
LNDPALLSGDPLLADFLSAVTQRAPATAC